MDKSVVKHNMLKDVCKEWRDRARSRETWRYIVQEVKAHAALLCYLKWSWANKGIDGINMHLIYVKILKEVLWLFSTPTNYVTVRLLTPQYFIFRNHQHLTLIKEARLPKYYDA
jgi:hypothetical protein